MKKYNLPLTYKPKIPKVINGECTQTIRAGRKFQVGDLISFHGWEDRPYRSKWSFKTPYFEVEKIFNIVIFDRGISPSTREEVIPWDFYINLAERDGIEPDLYKPEYLGHELGRVLTSYHKIPPEGLEAQIIRWKWLE